mmetsp:Transcript_18882/g.29097  ORF Transcript_18882/g.29097 Transcript_18882/m.29097 type:complete len:423 (-) Transcript_18882:321-1589(-)|eukprot:CAMPEP_0195292946 /NCGR_PEP_ID=MMETSP0707-20130614/11275_1 /TAXON_ID=33640 /ORGANISM="Asterionellopsis glacialis, Strain CCMP134" /LENGTH=422 /DNA_ID=CAMNT_0040353543 /DNA_START=439 /DNA_END=1707 /DNA_ORIENTATION=+
MRLSLLLLLASTATDSAVAFLHGHSTTHSAVASSSSPTALWMSKNNGRARMEKNLEDMMGNDWRVFRAKLVMQEQQEEDQLLSRNDGDSSNKKKNKKNKRHRSSSDDETLEKQGQLGDLFAGAISSMFSSKNSNNNNSNNSKSSPPASSSLPAGVSSIHQYDIFEGDTVGGADSPSSVSSTSSSSSSSVCEDPFVSHAELPILLKPKAKINKHRWAHSIPHVEPGCVLLANEKLGGVFHQTVVLVIDHHETTGSTGIIINRPMSGNLMQVASETESNMDLSLKLAFNNAPVTYGGPVQAEDYSLLHGYGQVEGSRKLCPGVFVGGSEELMNEVRLGSLRKEEALFVKGHAAWVPGQLSREIAKGVWYTAAVSSDFILRYAGAPTTIEDNKDDLWSDILTCMGGKHADIASQHSGRGDMRMMP